MSVERPTINLSIDDLVTKYAQPAEEKTFQIFFPGGEAITCAYPDRLGWIGAYKAELARFWRIVQSGKVPPSWQEFLPLTWDEAVAVVSLYHSSTEPTKFTTLQALRLLRAGGGYILAGLNRQIDERHQEIGYSQFVLEVEDQKKDSETTVSEESSSEPPCEPSESTSTT